MYPDYSPKNIEAKWQEAWEAAGLFRATETGDKPKYYCLDFFPYPSGEGLHVGHCRNYIPTDVISRFMRMHGYNVLHPMGWDAFGEPAEHYAVEHGVHPRLTTDQNTANFRRQMTLIGAGYDWLREIDSSRPEFYRWTQWFFIQLYQRGLAYRDTNWQWWCPTCQTTLSSHEVVNGVCWRGHPGVTRREIPAWYFRITAYADTLLDGLEEIDWPEPVKAMQRKWIGRSEGCEIIFRSERGETIPVFTTRPDTLYGVTFLALAPEHPLVESLTTPEQRSVVQAYLAQAASLGEVARMQTAREKTGVFSGSNIFHPITGMRLPVWIADYVLPGYGSGAVMGVPAHDQRDLEFARQFDLPVQVVISPDGADNPRPVAQAYAGDGIMVNSAEFDGLRSEVAIQRITEAIEALGYGQRKVQYRMHDWLISRQRYWGTPIPIVYCETCGEQLIPEDQLPVLLPPMQDFQSDGSGRSALARLPEFVHTTCPKCSGPATRETDTMGGFACSSWYFLRFTSPHYARGPFEPGALGYWMPVDLYVGGAEHAVLHLLYARFWTHFLADAGLVPFREPFSRLLNQGQLIAPDGQRMSKSRGNVITPDSMVEAYGADALRVYELFMAPFDQDVAWNVEGIIGARRFLNRVWGLYANAYPQISRAVAGDSDLERWLHKTIRKVSERFEQFRFNTAVSTLMEFVNALGDRQRTGAWQTKTYYQSLEALVVLLAPIAPHIAEELWAQTGHSGSVHQQNWPTWDEILAQDELVQIPVQVDGKVHQVIDAPQEADQAELIDLAYSQSKIRDRLVDRQVIQIHYIPGKILSIVTQRKLDENG
jgi:leucyl-tRNA synthetase